ncbi:ATP-binding cassette domain-containing protein [Sediminibacillus dalangtanensis]|uniref:ATP-binding cassette domain-containing protein n=1 Tax=Sediminibacillus dalangtanensis TaxID=2729421 RepID=A0ABX7W0E1_9BACI|nr:ATP-binding cassette domain-containing protein [Sediminibacillus dalangtanensis]
MEFQNVSKVYNLFKKKSDLLFDIFSINKSKKTFSALRNISFEVYKGETIGIIGINGSGKSTLSSILAEVIPATTGRISIDGEPSLVAISAGLNNFITGRENITLKCLMYGLNRKEIDEIMPDIIEFADIGDFIDQPIKNYSSGMKSRLGFAISVHIQPDILVIDEALSVGDSTFYQKCLDKFEEFKKEGKTIFFISHSLSQVKSISDRIMWLNFGQLEEFGEADVVADKFQKFINWFNKLSKDQKQQYRKEKLRSQILIEKKRDFVLENKRSSRKKSKGASKTTLFQLGLLVAIFFLSMLLQVFGNPFQAIQDNSEQSEATELSKETELDVNSQANITPFNTTGWITVANAMLFTNVNLDKKVHDVPFGSEISILGEVEENSLYLAKVDGKEGFLKADDLTIASEEDLNTSLDIDDFSTALPERFVNSQEFFLSFLGATTTDLENSTTGITDISVDSDGRKTIEFKYDQVTYFTDSQGMVNSIQINIDSTAPVFNKLDIEAKIKSKDGNLYHFTMMDKFSADIDFTKDVITLKNI